jgi:Rrf2 family protein
MISNKCKYAIRALLYLAVNSDEDKKTNIIEIGDALNIPIPYLRKILQELVPKGIISSNRGPNGGFYMTDKNLSVSLIDVVDAIDGLSIFESCGLGLDKCSEKLPCPFHQEYKLVREQYKAFISSKKLSDLAKDIKHSNYLLVN